MGWDYTHATHYTRTGAIDRKTEIDELYTWQNDTRKAEVVRSAMVGSTYYAAIKITELSIGEAETTAAVALTHGIISTLELRRWGKVLDHVKIIARLLFSLFSPLLIQNMPITGARDAERTLKQRKIRTH